MSRIEELDFVSDAMAASNGDTASSNIMHDSHSNDDDDEERQTIIQQQRPSSTPPPPLSSNSIIKSSSHDTLAILSLRQSLTTTNKGGGGGLNSRVASSSSLLSLVDIGEEEDQAANDIDNNIIHPHTRAFTQAIQTSVQTAFGIIGIDVWIQDEHDGSFSHAPHGYYRHENYQPTTKMTKELYALSRIEDTTSKNHIPPTRLIAGTGLAGYFWTQCSIHDKSCTWRDVRAITSDPDQPPDLRTSLFEEAGYGQATGVPFDIRGHRGVVLFLAREGACHEQLSELANDVHLRVSADLIGAISANCITSEASVAAKRMRLVRTIRRIKAKLFAVLAFNALYQRRKMLVGDGNADDSFTDNSYTMNGRGKVRRGSKIDRKASLTKRLSMSFEEKVLPKAQQAMRKSYRQSILPAMKDALVRRSQLLIEKSKGGRVQPPPSMPWIQSLWVFVGAFVTLLLLSAISSTLANATSGEYSIILGPFGALMTLQYGLTPAPASQPRNVWYGQTVSISIALVVNLFISASSWVRVPLSTALAISVMCKLGITHPPAGAAAAIFASNDVFDGVYFALMLVGNCIAISMAILVNNLNDKKQYPIYYAFIGDKTKGRVGKLFERCREKCKMSSSRYDLSTADK